ncbi:unnamed protein product [Ostreobium quekettii]|uniref:Zinc finger HIT domain-containing protein n=1 Tax=Ostreobium quekettii TaxID=121088 RepID=A0A8S1IRA0_9CHLO|nr:unnamed protein product [Ostreobium quekettii]
MRPPQKVDFVLTDLDAAHAAASALKAGDRVAIAPSDDGPACTTPRGTCLGRVPDGALDEFHPGMALEARVQSVRRAQGGAGVREVTVRVRKATAAAARQVEAVEEPEDEDNWRVKQQQFELLVGSESLRLMLKDERLQNAIRLVDTAPEREQALDAAMTDPAFREFTDKLLDAIHPGCPSKGS